MHDKFKLAQSRRQFADLFSLAQDQEKALAEDPRPFLDRAYREVVRHRKLLADVRAALMGIEISERSSVQFETTESRILRRQRKALDLLRNAFNGSGESNA